MKKIMFILLGFMLGIVGTSYAAYKLTAKEVSFDNNKTYLNGDNVQIIIDEIADKLKYGDAEESDIASGKTALVKGKKIVGTNSVKPTITYQQLPLVGSYNKFGPLDIDHRDLFVNVFPVAQKFIHSTGNNEAIKWAIDSNGYLIWNGGTGVAISSAGVYLID